MKQPSMRLSIVGLFLVFIGMNSITAKLLAIETSPEIRECVFIIKPHLHEDSVKLLYQLAGIFEKNENDTVRSFADYFRGLARGGHGSGFLYVDAGGANYIITNRHVVEGATSADIITRNGSSYDLAPIVYLDSKADLAVLQFPQNRHPYKKGLSIQDTPTPELTRVYAAGYPSFGHKPLWQISEGNITNESVMLAKTRYIQHSAAIGPGNSAGPTLIHKGSGYVVIGVNTIMTTEVQDRYFAVPSSEVIRVIRETREISHMTVSDKARSLESICHEFADEMTSENPDIERMEEFISPQMVATIGYKCFQTTIKPNDDISNTFMEAFINDPLSTMKLAILMSMKHDLNTKRNGGRIVFNRIHHSDRGRIGDNTQTVRTFFQCGGSTQEEELAWMFEYGRWRIIKSMAVDKGIASSTCQFINEPQLNELRELCDKKYPQDDDKFLDCLAITISEYCKKINGGENTCSNDCVNDVINQVDKIMKKAPQ